MLFKLIYHIFHAFLTISTCFCHHILIHNNIFDCFPTFSNYICYDILTKFHYTCLKVFYSIDGSVDISDIEDSHQSARGCLWNFKNRPILYRKRPPELN